ncbi:hypothetical protein SY83_01605 [Paenibacillus swuensis]|uniref:F5/8 type C domain-containing protein n=1 Tax=Paenibacillus swuensis TaxID=1178515 RepID=A0A172TEB7_9BACL|nr:discoidin domain-containing protein [Paenibacillus swuensis]ANE45237.1 hypothetical protein SY83_01605 [Paenibacillus swuensis]
MLIKRTGMRMVSTFTVLAMLFQTLLMILQPAIPAAAAAETVQNVSSNKPVTVSSRAEEAGNLVDGNADTHWYSEWGQSSAWMKIDLGQSFQLHEIQLNARYESTLWETVGVSVYGANQADYSDRVAIAQVPESGIAYSMTLPVSDTTPYRYIMLEKTIPDSLGFSEVNVMGSITQPEDALYTNVALGKPVTASGVLEGAYAAENGNDGNSSPMVTNWDGNAYWQVDLGREYSIAKLQLVPRDGIDWERRNYSILASNDASFQESAVIGTIGSEGFDNLWNAVVTDPAPYRYVRVKTTDTKSVGLTDFRVLVQSTAYEMAVSDLLQVVPRFSGTDIGLNEAVWTSSNQGVASVDSSGKISAYSKGTTTITAAYQGKTLSLPLTVKPAPEAEAPTSPDLFASFLTGQAPVVTKVISESTEGTISIKRVLFQSDLEEGRQNQIYALIARPTASGSYPGLLVLHGGAGTADEGGAKEYAKRGYIAIAPELPGIADPNSQWASPDSTGVWKSEPYGLRQLRALPDASASSIFEAEVAALQSFYLLKAQPEIQPGNVGMKGISWGGYTTTMVSSLLGDDVKAAYSIYGSGFYDHGSYFKGLLDGWNRLEKMKWLKDLDAGRRAQQLTANYFVAAATNDSYFWPTAVMDTLDRISGPVNQVFSPNDDHTLAHLADESAQEQLYFDYHLKGEGAVPPKVQVEGSKPLANGSIQIRFSVSGGTEVTNFKLYYSSPDASWTTRSWTEVQAAANADGSYGAVLPAEAAAEEADWYVFASDSRGVSASSVIYSADSLAEQPPVVQRDTFYVSPEGDDSNEGTQESPLRTLEAARNAVRLQTRTMKGDITVNLRGGVYRVDGPVDFGPLDSGQNGFQVRYQAFPGETPVIEGGKGVSGTWEPYTDGIYRIQADSSVLDMRELVVDGKRQQRAKSAPVKTAGIEGERTSLMVANDLLPAGGFAFPQDLSFSMLAQWRHYILPVSGMTRGDTYTKVNFTSEIMNTYIQNHNFDSYYNKYFIVENALELLDEEGEWYFDKRALVLYYKPQPGVDLNAAVIEIPQAEAFINITGLSNTKRVRNLAFQGITFSNATWEVVNSRGFASVQSTTIVNEKGAMEDIIPAVFNVNYADKVTISRNTFERIGKSAINAEQGISDLAVTGNIFNDIAGGAVNIGSTSHGTLTQAGASLPKRITVSNNVLRDIGSQFWGSAAITAFYYDTLAIEYNDVDGANYSAISVGWGWSGSVDSLRNLKVNYNKLFNVNRKTVDGGAVYSMSSHVNAGLKGNYVMNVGGAFNTAALYHDQSSSGFVNEDNVVDAERGDYTSYNLNGVSNITITDLYTTTGNIVNYSPGPNVRIENVHIHPDGNWPAAAQAIIAGAGLQQEYKDLLEQVKVLLERKDIPFIRSSGVFVEDTYLFHPYSSSIDRDLAKAPFEEKNGLAVFDATEFTGYKGTEAADYSYLGWINAPRTGSAKYGMITHPKQMTRPVLAAPELPELTYDIQFQTPGDYLVFVLAKEGTVKVGFNQQEMGTIAFPDTFAWKNGGLKVRVEQAGIHKLHIWNTNTKNAIERVVLTKAATAEVYENSVLPGPPTSPKAGKPSIFIPAPPAYPAFSKETGTNIAMNRPASASSSSPGHAPEQALDGLSITSWRSGSADSSVWWQADLLESTPIHKLDIRFPEESTAEERRQFEVLGANDAAFTHPVKLGEQGEEAVPPGGIASFLVEENNGYRYVRIQKTVSGEPLALAEVKVVPSKPVLVNVALERPVEASSGQDSAARLVDGNKDNSTVWTSSYESEHFIRLDLLAAYRLNSIVISAGAETESAAWNGITVYGANSEDYSDKVKLETYIKTDGGTVKVKLSGKPIYRYVLLETTSASAVKLSASEVEVYGVIPQPDNAIYANVAQGKPAIATSEYSDQYKAAHINDGNFNSAYVVKNWSNDEYVQVDLGDGYAIDKIQVVPRAGNIEWERKGFAVLGSNEPDFSSAKTLGLAGGDAFPEGEIWTAVVADPSLYRYIRMKKTDGSGIGLAELRVLVHQTSSRWETGKTLHLAARVLGEDITKDNVDWKSSDSSILSVQSDGTAKALSKGNVVITASYQGTSVTLPVTVYKEHDTDLLEKQITEAEEALTNHHAGSNPGQSSSGEYSELARQVNDAKAVVQGAAGLPQADIDAAADQLKAAVSLFLKKVIVTEPLLKVTGYDKRSVSLSWTPGKVDEPVVSFILYMNGKVTKVTTASVLTAVIQNLNKDTQYTFSIQAINEYGHRSPLSPALQVRTKHDNGKGERTEGNGL